MLGYHDNPQPATCDVCSYAVDHDVDCGYEHARTRVATAWLLQDLAEADEPLRLSGVTVSTAGIEPGPIHRLEPRHWYWAMFHEPAIRISLRRHDR